MLPKELKILAVWNIITNSRVTPSWREIVSLTFSEAGILHVNWTSLGHCVSQLKDIGEVDVILGIKIKRENKGIVITQSHYIEKILKKFNREDCSSVSTPMDPVEKLKPYTGKLVDKLEYSRAIGCLMYAMTSTRQDIAYAVGRLNRFTSNPGRHH
ncbi:zinc finger, CCHC-type containing protein [Tanacetum coccineum]